MSFRGRSFVFDGTPSEEFDLVVANIGNASQESGIIGSELEILESRIPRRPVAIHHGTVGNAPLSFPIVFSANRDNMSFDRYDIARIAAWLTGHQHYKKLIIDQSDMECVYYNCIITGLTQVEAGGKVIGFQAAVTCDAPFAYRIFPETIIECEGSTMFNYHCSSNVNDYYTPDLIIETEATDLTIVNDTDGSTFSLSGMSGSQKTITINGQSLVMESSDGTNLYNHWNVDAPKYMFRALGGDNYISITGACTIIIKNEVPWNIGY